MITKNYWYVPLAGFLDLDALDLIGVITLLCFADFGGPSKKNYFRYILRLQLN